MAVHRKVRRSWPAKGREQEGQVARRPTKDRAHSVHCTGWAGSHGQLKVVYRQGRLPEGQLKVVHTSHHHSQVLPSECVLSRPMEYLVGPHQLAASTTAPPHPPVAWFIFYMVCFLCFLVSSSKMISFITYIIRI